MKSRKDFYNIDEFIRVLLEQGVSKAAFTQIDERRAIEKGRGEIQVVPYRKLEILAYKDSIIYSYVEEGDVDFERAFRKIEERGIEPVKRSRNIL
jgi:hypothetical protein